MLQKGQRVGYVRVSSVDQNANRQLADVQLDKVFEDKLSGKDTERPALKQLIEYVRDGDHVFVHSLDRLARNLKDLLALVTEITDKGVTLTFVKESLTFSNDESNPAAKLLMSVMGAIAEFERALIRERQREGIEAAKKRHDYHPGRPVKLSAEVRAQIRTRRADGVTIARLADEYRVARQTIYRVMKEQN